MKLAVVSASLGGFDKETEQVEQTLPCAYHLFTDENFPPRTNAMLPRLQAKIPKMFAWQLLPDHDYYLWLDGSIKLADPNAAQYFYDQIQGFDVAVLKHETHVNVKHEWRYTKNGIYQKNRYLYPRYKDEFVYELFNVIKDDPDFVDDSLYIGGLFIYRNTPAVHEMMKNWWYFVSRYLIQDQVSWTYVLKKSGLKIKVLPTTLSQLYLDGYITKEKHHFKTR